MPWNADDAVKHNKGLSLHQREAWAKIANNALEQCQSKGGKDCDVYAIKVANAAIHHVHGDMTDAELMRIAKRKDVSPGEGESKYGDVKFADPENKKYPIDTEEHIKAAWNYINKDKNGAKYSGGDLTSIKRKIVAAWKSKIDPDGPPSARQDGGDGSDTGSDAVGDTDNDDTSTPVTGAPGSAGVLLPLQVAGKKKKKHTSAIKADGRTFWRAFKPQVISDTEGNDAICGVVRGIALVYGVVDTFGTLFEVGCLTQTRNTRVAAGKVKLFWDHGDVASAGFYDTDLHIGTVRSLEDAEVGSMQVAIMEADILNTEEGRKAHAYLKSVLASGGETGLSIGMQHEPRGAPGLAPDGTRCFRITEVSLREISITAESSVPGTKVLAVRYDTVLTPAPVPPTVTVTMGTPGDPKKDIPAPAETNPVPTDMAQASAQSHAPDDDAATVGQGDNDADDSPENAEPEPDATALRAMLDHLMRTLPRGMVDECYAAMCSDADAESLTAPNGAVEDEDAEDMKGVTPAMGYAWTEDREWLVRRSLLDLSSGI